MTSTRKTSKSRALYYRQYRKNATEEQKRKWARQAKVRYERAKIRARALRKKIEKSKRNRRDYLRRCDQQAKVPSTPNSKLKLLNHLLDSASPATAQKFAEHGLYGSRERKARDEIVNATHVAVKQHPSVRKALVTQLNQSPTVNKSAVSEVLGVSRTHFNYKSTKGRNPRTKAETIELVVNFYRRPDIATHYPNKNKNFVILRQSRKKTFSLFKLEYPDVKISASSFYKLKPSSVKLMKAAKYLQCLCDICDSITMMVRSIKLSFMGIGLPVPIVLLPGNERDLAGVTVCSLKQLSCVNRKCSKCSPEIGLRPLLGDWAAESTTISYTVWERVEETVKGKTLNKMRKVTKTEPRADLYKALCQRLVKFAAHICNAVSQLSAYKKCKESLKKGEAACVIDFAENYVCRQYAESQTTYYVRNSVTIHPMVLIFPENSEVKRDSVVCISDDLTHDATSVKSFFAILGVHLRIYYPDVKHLIVWSDGCSCQYKSRDPMFNLSKSMNLPVSMTWNFYGSRHGKSESDGESGVVKTYLDTIVKAAQHTLNTAKDVYDLLTNSDRHIMDGSSRRHFYYMKSTIIEKMRKERVKNQVALKGIRSLHSAKPNAQGTGILYKPLSCYCKGPCWHPQEWKEFIYPG